MCAPSCSWLPSLPRLRRRVVPVPSSQQARGWTSLLPRLGSRVFVSLVSTSRDGRREISEGESHTSDRKVHIHCRIFASSHHTYPHPRSHYFQTTTTYPAIAAAGATGTTLLAFAENRNISQCAPALDTESSTIAHNGVGHPEELGSLQMRRSTDGGKTWGPCVAHVFSTCRLLACGTFEACMIDARYHQLIL